RNLFAVGLRYRNKYPDRVDLRDLEKFKRRAAVSRIDEISDIGPALRDDPIKWSEHALEPLHLLKAAYVCICGLQVCFLCFQILVVRIDILLRDGIGTNKSLISFCRDAGQGEIGLHLAETGSPLA